MEEMGLLILCILVTTLIGWNVLYLLSCRRGLSNIAVIEVMGLAYLFGFGIITIQMFIMSLFKIGFTRLNILIPWVFVAGGTFVCRERFLSLPRAKPDIEETSPYQAVSAREIILISIIALQTLYNFFRALIKPIESYDAVAIYGLKSKILYLSGGVTSDFFQNVASNFHGAHPDYPLLIPLAETWVYTFLGKFDDHLVKAIFPLFYLSFIFIFYAVLKRIIKNRSLALLFTFSLASIKQFSDYSTIGVADLALGIYFAVGLFYLYLWIAERKNTHFLHVSLISSVLCLWTKNEGLLLLLIILFILFMHAFLNIQSLKKSGFSYVVNYIFIVSLCIVSWHSFMNYQGLVNENFNLSMVSLKNLISSLSKTPAILYGYQKELFGFKKWNIFWVLFMAILFLQFKNAFSKNLKYITSVILLFGLSYFLMYIFSAVEIGYFVRVTASRFLLHISPITMLWIAIVANETYMRKT